MTDTKKPDETRVVLPVDPTRRTEIDKQRVPMSARPYRLLALVKQDAVVRVQKEPDDTVMTWPHLLSIEFLAAGVMSVFLLLMGLFINAPLEIRPEQGDEPAEHLRQPERHAAAERDPQQASPRHALDGVIPEAPDRLLRQRLGPVDRLDVVVAHGRWGILRAWLTARSGARPCCSRRTAGTG